MTGLAPAGLAQRLAELKCAAVADEVGSGRLVLGCDSVLELDGEALGKPGDPDEAVRRWRAMRGRTRRSSTPATACATPPSGDQATGTGSTVVHFADVTDDEITAYVESGEPLQVAGAFTIDGLGGAFVTRIEGDHHNVVGLSLPLLRDLRGRARPPLDRPLEPTLGPHSAPRRSPRGRSPGCAGPSNDTGWCATSLAVTGLRKT